jgi:hypothetical protein
MSFGRSGVRVPSESSPAALYRRLFVRGNAAEVADRLVSSTDTMRGM